MKNIGKSRRKEPKKRKPNENPNLFLLEIPEPFYRIGDSSKTEITDTLDDHDIRKDTGVIFPPEYTPSTLSVMSNKPISSSVQPSDSRNVGDMKYYPQIERLWTGRTDPFVRYPIVRYTPFSPAIQRPIAEAETALSLVLS